MFNKKLKKEVADLRGEVQQLRQVKGYFDQDNADNALFKRLYQQGFKMVSFSAVNRAALKDCYKHNSAVFGLVDMQAKAVAEIAQYIELQDSNNKVVDKHWILDLLREPNDRENRARFLKGWAVQKKVYGDSFVYMLVEQGSNRRIKNMYIMPGDKVGISEGGWREPIKGYTIANSTETEEIPVTDVMHSYNYNIDGDDFFGFSPLVAAAADVQIMRHGKERQNTSLINGGVNTIITPAPDKMGVLPKDAIDLENKLNNPQNVNKTQYLRAAVDVHKIGGTPVELSILDGSKESITALCFAYGIPVDLYFGQSKYENAREARRALYESVAIPMLNEFCEDFMAYCHKYFPTSTKGLKLVVNTDNIDVLKSSGKETLENMALCFASINERRAAWGLEPLPDKYANEPVLPLGVQMGYNEYDVDENAK